MKPAFLADNRLLEGTPTATSEAAGFPVANLLDRRPYTFWQAADTATQDIIVDCGAVKSADTLAIAGHNLSGAGLELATSTDGAAWTVKVAAFDPGTDKSFMHPFGKLIGGVRSGKTLSSQWWRLRITGAAAAPYIGVLMIGSRIEAARFPASFAPEDINADVTATRSKAGHLLGSTVNFFNKAISATLPYPGDAWCQEQFKPFYEQNAGLPFFFGWDLDAWPDKAGLVTFAGGYKPTYDKLGRISALPISLRGVWA